MNVSSTSRIDQSYFLEKINPKFTENLEITLLHKAVNPIATDPYQQMSAVRSKGNRNFIFFTPTFISLLSMLYAGATRQHWCNNY